MQQIAHKAYGDVANRTADDRQVELTLFKQITAALEAVAASENPSASERAEAVSRNLELWSTLAVDIAHPENGLSQDLKGGLLYLAEFTRRTGMTILTDGDAKIEDLIEINNSVIGGLA